jgi:hypothetical protein
MLEILKWKEIPEEIRKMVFNHFFDENDNPIITYSQYHKETMCEHVKIVLFYYLNLVNNNKYNLCCCWPHSPIYCE